MLQFKNQTADQLARALADLQPPPRLIRQLHSAVLRQDWTELPRVWPSTSPRLLDQLRQRTEIPRLTPLERAVSSTDGFVRYAFRGDDSARFEAVRIPLLHRPEDPKYVACVSSQVGCALGCVFCATGRLGFRRQLATWEIVDQVVRLQADAAHPIRGVVFMGMGEPLLNYEAVMRAAAVLSEPCGLAIAAKAITISTVGIVPAIRRFTAERQPYRLIVSLTSAIPERRRALLPIEQNYPLPELFAALRDYQQATRRRLTLAWTVLGGINTSREEVRALATIVGDLPVQLDLIDVNDPTGQFRRAADDELAAFRDALREELGQPVIRRYSGGQDIRGGCGMLAGTVDLPAPPPELAPLIPRVNS